jgi:hypothetical protein
VVAQEAGHEASGAASGAIAAPAEHGAESGHAEEPSGPFDAHQGTWINPIVRGILGVFGK